MNNLLSKSTRAPNASLADEIINAIPDAPDHKFSFKYNLKKFCTLMKIKTYIPRRKLFVKRLVYYCAMSVILMTLLTMNTFGTHTEYENFLVISKGKDAIVTPLADPTAPKKLEHSFDITYGLDKYTKAETYEIDDFYIADYEDEDGNFLFSLSVFTVNLGMKMSFDLEHSPTDLVDMEINGCETLYSEIRSEVHSFAMANGKYIYDFYSHLSKEESVKIIESIKMAEKN